PPISPSMFCDSQEKNRLTKTDKITKFFITVFVVLRLD
ncbi:MAG: hypothetical protein ACJAVW_003365, partial [Spirosomataceae bacterium]